MPLESFSTLSLAYINEVELIFPEIPHGGKQTELITHA